MLHWRAPCWIATLLAAAAAHAADGGQALPQRMQPLLERYCYRCHGPATQTAGIDFAAFRDRQSILEKRRLFVRALELVRSREMPAAGPLPSEAERLELAAAIDEAVNRLDWDKIENPGNETIPRLTAAEYNNTIRELTGLDLRPADRFPADGAGPSGFTTDRDGLFISPLLMERYLQAAERIVETLIAARQPASLERRIEVETMYDTERNTPKTDYGYKIWKFQDTLYRYVRFPRFGRYAFRVRAWGESENRGEQPGLTLRVANRIVGKTTVLATEDDPAIYAFHANVPPGNHRVSLHWHKVRTAAGNALQEKLIAEKEAREAALLARGEKPRRNGRAVQLALDWIDIRDDFTTGQDGSRVFIAQPTARRPPAEAAKTIFESFASRAYRRPVKLAELDYLLGRFRQAEKHGESFERAVGQGLKAVLVSPNFLFRPEQSDAGKDRLLDAYELASRLSYFLWLSPPDAELTRRASDGSLLDRETRQAQVKRMLADPRAERFFDAFAGQWLGYRELGKSAVPDKATFDAFTVTLMEAMKDEGRLFFGGLVRDDRSLLELLDADYAYLNEELAGHYGISGVTGAEMRRVALGEAKRGGVLGWGAVLTATSTPLRTSPVIRGKWVLETLFGEQLPPPPPDAGELAQEDGQTAGQTVRRRLERHRNDPECAACHNRIDPLGFALENYDAIGRWRDEENGLAVDVSGVLPTGQRFDGVDQLKDILLAQKERFAKTVVERMLAFALGRKLEYYDEPAVRKIVADVIAADYKIGKVIEGVAACYPFRYRRADTPGKNLRE